MRTSLIALTVLFLLNTPLAAQEELSDPIGRAGAFTIGTLPPATESEDLRLIAVSGRSGGAAFVLLCPASINDATDAIEGEGPWQVRFMNPDLDLQNIHTVHVRFGQTPPGDDLPDDLTWTSYPITPLEDQNAATMPSEYAGLFLNDAQEAEAEVGVPVGRDGRLLRLDLTVRMETQTDTVVSRFDLTGLSETLRQIPYCRVGT